MRKGNLIVNAAYIMMSIMISLVSSSFSINKHQMAYSSSVEVGYDVEVMGGYPPNLNCSICTLIIKQAMYGCQKHTFCSSCIERHVEFGVRTEGHVTCPGGCREVIDATKLQPNYFADMMINTLKSKCSNKPCTWQGDLLDLVQVHQIKCEYIKVACHNDGCNEMFLKKDVKLHDKDCLYQLIQCQYCHNDIAKVDQFHEDSCLVEEITCEYNDIGCSVKFCRKDVDAHEMKYQVQHTRLIYSNCKKELAKSNDEVLMLRELNVALMNEFKELKASSHDEITSLKDQVMQMNADLLQVKKEKINMRKDMKRKFDGNLESHDLKLKVNKSSTHLSVLKTDLSRITTLVNRITLINGDTVVHAQYCFDFRGLGQLFDCYKQQRFEYIISKLKLNQHQVLLSEIFHEVPNHFYDGGDEILFFFQADVVNMKDFDVTIPDHFNMTIINNVIEVVTTSSDNSIHFYIGKYWIVLKNGIKFDLKTVDDTMVGKRFSLKNASFCCLYI